MNDLHRQLLRVIRSLEPEAYGVPIRRALAAEGRDVSYGTLYCALADLENEGLVRVEEERGVLEQGRRRRCYRFVTEDGLRELSRVVETARSASDRTAVSVLE